MLRYRLEISLHTLHTVHSLKPPIETLTQQCRAVSSGTMYEQDQFLKPSKNHLWNKLTQAMSTSMLHNEKTEADFYRLYEKSTPPADYYNCSHEYLNNAQKCQSLIIMIKVDNE